MTTPQRPTTEVSAADRKPPRRAAYHLEMLALASVALAGLWLFILLAMYLLDLTASGWRP